MRLRCLVVALALLVAFASDSRGQSKDDPPQQTPEINAKQKPDGGLKPEQPAEQQSATPPLAVVPEGTNRKCDSHCPDAEQEGTEFWPPFHGYRLKVTDTLVAAFTALLFIATIALWRSTRRLVKGAEITAQRQLRAYVLVTRTRLYLDGPNGPVVKMRIKNTGQTPAENLTWVGAYCFYPYPPTAATFDLDPPRLPPAGPLGPLRSHKQIHVYEGFNAANRKAFDDGIAAFYLIGEIRYTDAFRQPRVTKYRLFLGGRVRVSESNSFAQWDDGNEIT